MVQEVEQSYDQEIEHLDVQISIKPVIKSVIKSVAWNRITETTFSCCWHAVAIIQTNDFMDRMIRCWIIGMRRIGVGWWRLRRNHTTNLAGIPASSRIHSFLHASTISYSINQSFIRYSINQVSNPREIVGCTLLICLVSRILLAIRMHAFILFNNGSLARY